MKVNQKNWDECLESLGFVEQKNASFGGMVVFNDDGIPMWAYETEEEKERLYAFFRGAVYWKIHTELKHGI